MNDDPNKIPADSADQEVSYTGGAPGGIKIIAFKEVKPGDLRKFLAQSNDADTGGGARDLRFRPHDKFAPIFARMFPDVEQGTGRRGKQTVQVDFQVGRVHYPVNGKAVSQRAEYWPPTDARPGEGRWAKVYAYAPFKAAIPEDEGRIIVLLVQNTSNEVWLYIRTEQDIRSGGWHQAVVDAIFNCVDAKRDERRSSQGYIDFERSVRYCNAG
jgi:hypothetical protein